MIKDIEDIYSAKLDLQSAGIGSLKILCGLGTEVSHNALDDAVDLKNIIKHIDLEGCSEHMLQIMKSIRLRRKCTTDSADSVKMGRCIRRNSEKDAWSAERAWKGRYSRSKSTQG